MQHWLRVFRYFQADALRLGWVVVLVVAGTVANLLKPWPVALIVDSVLGSKPLPGWLAEWMGGMPKPELLTISAGIILGLYLVQASLSTWYNYLSIAIGLSGLRRVRNELFARLQGLSWHFYQGSRTGDLIYRASWDSYAFQTAFQQGLITVLSSMLSLVLMLWVMFRLNVRLTLTAAATLPLLLLTIKVFGEKMRLRGTAAQQADSQVTALVQQNITALPLIQSYTQEGTEQARFTAQTALARSKRLAQHGWELLYGLGVAAALAIGTAAIVLVGSGQVLANRLSVGELLVFLAYLAQLFEPLRQLSNVGATISTARAGTQRVFEILDAPEEVKDAPDAKIVVSGAHQEHVVPGSADVLRVQGRVRFENVSFGYTSECPVLRDINLELEPGKSVAILGPSGAGKTTLLQLLPRFYDPGAGSVKLDGIDLRQLRLHDLRAHIALVFQNSILMPATIAENIALGRPSAKPAEIEDAARAANAHEFIQRLPRRYDTLVGEGAARLSQGEIQRIGLARAFLKDAPILLLDEPTSALDLHSEGLILSGLDKLMDGRTTLIVAHRLNTIQRVDRIVVLRAGRIAEEGTPSELMNRTGSYYAQMQLRD